MTYVTPEINVFFIDQSDVLTITSGGTTDVEPTIGYGDIFKS